MTCLKGTGVDTSALKDTPPSMAKWRYETVCAVFRALALVRNLWQHHLRREWWVNPHNRNEVGAAIDVQHDELFWEFIAVSDELVWQDAAHNRRWGLICACEQHTKDRQEGKKHIQCVWNSRRLPDAGDYVVQECNKAQAKERNLTPSQCGNNREVLKAVRTLLQVKRSEATLKGKHLNMIPWAFAQAWSEEGAQKCWDQVKSRPIEDHDVLVQDFMQRWGGDLDKRRQGEDLSEAFREEIALWDLLPICEDPGEGYHSLTSRELTRASGSSVEHLKQDVRRDQELDRLSKWASFGDEGKRVIRFEWRSWKRILQTGWSQRHVPKNLSAQAAFRRIYHDDELSAQDWTAILKLEQPNRPVVAEDTDNAQQLQTEYLAATLVKGNFYAVPIPKEVVREDGERVAQEETEIVRLLSTASSSHRPKVMHTYASADDAALSSRLALEIQPYTLVAAAAGVEDAIVVRGEVGLENSAVFAEVEPYWISALSLAPADNLLYRLHTFTTEERDDERPGITILSGVCKAKPMMPLTDPSCPALLVYIALKAIGWIPQQSKVVHCIAGMQVQMVLPGVLDIAELFAVVLFRSQPAISEVLPVAPRRG